MPIDYQHPDRRGMSATSDGRPVHVTGDQSVRSPAADAAMPGEGWHPDPDGIHQFRYHDGGDWTPHVANDGAVCQAPRRAPMVPPPPPLGVTAAAAEASAQDDEWLEHLAFEYRTACSEVFAVLEPALNAANDANSARSAADVRPQHEISIRNFTNLADQMDQQFAGLYQDFMVVSTKAKEAGIRLAGAVRNRDPEVWFFTLIGPEAYSEVSAAVEYLRMSYGPSPRAFTVGIGRATEIIQTSPSFGEPGFRGSIYTERASSGANSL